MATTNSTFLSSIVESSFELNAYEKAKYKDVSNAAKLDDLTQSNEHLIIAPKGYVVVEIVNSKSENPNYNNYVVIDKDGNKFVTGSQSFWNAFIDIWNDMKDYDGDWEIEVLRKPSKNFKGKDFLTCSLV